MSKIEVDAIDKQSGSTLTLGGSGTAVTLACGATQTGFGRTGTVDWQTSIKTSTITVVNGEGYFVNTTGGAITANLPAGSAGAIVSFRDYANTFDSNSLTVSPNGSEKINGLAVDLIVSTEGESLTLVYADATKGWLIVNDGNNDAGSQIEYVAATGGTITTVCTNFKVHTFTGPGTFTVTNAGNAAGSNTVDYLVVAGGGGGGSDGGGGAGGGYRESSGANSGGYTRSPLGACVSALSVPATAYPITVGGGGPGAPTSGNGTNGSNSIFSTITSAGGGRGGDKSTPCKAGANGGSGGGAARDAGGGAGSGNTPPVSPPQGNNGGAQPATSAADGAGGGGAGAVGSNGGSPGTDGGGPGAAGTPSDISSSTVVRAGGGGGGTDSVNTPGGGGTGGSGGGGPGGKRCVAGGAGSANLGGGGGSGGTGAAGGQGGSGVVIIRYKFQ